MTNKEVKDRMITDVYTLKDIFKVIAPISSKCRIDISENGWNVIATDPRHVASLKLNVPKEYISSYDINTNYRLNTNIAQNIMMLEDMDDYDNADIILETIDLNGIKNYSMRLKIGIINHNITFNTDKDEKYYQEATSNEQPTEQLTEISVNSKDFKVIAKEFEKFSDYILFETRDGKLRVSCVGSYNFMEDHEIHAYLGDGIVNNIKCLFDLGYLNRLIRSINTNGHWNDNITLFLGTNLPLNIRFNVGRYGIAVYTLAPRI